MKIIIIDKKGIKHKFLSQILFWYLKISKEESASYYQKKEKI